MRDTTTNTEKPSDAQTTTIVSVGLLGFFLTAGGVLGMLEMACRAIYEAYGPLPLLTLSTSVGVGLLALAKRMLSKLQGGS